MQQSRVDAQLTNGADVTASATAAAGLPTGAVTATSWLAGGSAAQTLAALSARPGGVLVSAETVKDYSLQPGG